MLVEHTRTHPQGFFQARRRLLPTRLLRSQTHRNLNTGWRPAIYLFLAHLSAKPPKFKQKVPTAAAPGPKTKAQEHCAPAKAQDDGPTKPSTGGLKEFQ